MIIIYDGTCGVCNSTIQFVLKNKPKSYFRFVSFQSEKAAYYLDRYKINTMDSIWVIEDEKGYSKSTAFFKIIKGLQTKWRYVYIFIVIPKFIRDWFYVQFSKNRYRIKNKEMQCRILTEDERKFFLN